MSDNRSSGGIGPGSLLTIAFVVLKLCHVINWSWWWVLSPVWGAVALWLIGVCVVAAIEIRKEDRAARQQRRSKCSRLNEIWENELRKRAEK